MPDEFHWAFHRLKSEDIDATYQSLQTLYSDINNFLCFTMHY